MTAGFSLRKIKNPISLGQRFKRARKRLGVEISEAEIQTKIRSKYLDALERDDFMDLPADAYTKGFVLRYAKFLGLDGEKSMQDYLRLKSQANIRSDGLIGPSKKFRDSSLIITPKLFTTFAICLLIIGVFTYLFVQISGFATTPDLKIISPQNNEVLYSDKIEIRGTTSVQAEVSINDQKIQPSSDGSFSTDYKLIAGINVIQVKSKNRANKEKSLTYTVEYKAVSANIGHEILN